MGAQSLCANSEMCVGVRMREGWREESLDDKRNGPCIPDSLFHSPDSGRAEKVFFFQIFFFSLSLVLTIKQTPSFRLHFNTSFYELVPLSLSPSQLSFLKISISFLLRIADSLNHTKHQFRLKFL